jgi:hypothetical protein
MVDALGNGDSGGFAKAISAISAILWIGIALLELFLLGRLLLLYKGAGPKIETATPGAAYAPAPGQ